MEDTQNSVIQAILSCSVYKIEGLMEDMKHVPTRVNIMEACILMFCWIPTFWCTA